MSAVASDGPERLAARGRPRVAEAAAAAVVAAAVLAPLAIHWAAGETLAWWDTARLYAPARWMIDEALRAFRLPLWNPFVGGGMPLLADAVHGVLHPVSIAVAWLGAHRSADLLIGGYVGCAGVGAAWLARELGASRAAAAVAAFAFALSGFVLSMAGNLVFLAGAASLPICLAGLRRAALDPRPLNLAIGAGAAATLALSGDLQAAVVGAAVALPLAWEAAGWRGVARAAGAGAAGVLLAGVQLVPAAVHFLRSDRADPSWVVSPHVWSLEPWRLPELVVPGLLSSPDARADRVYAELAGSGHWFEGALPAPFARSVWIGVVPLALAAVGAREGRRGRVLAAVAAALLWAALGPLLGASTVLARVPVWSAFRYPEKLAGPLTLVLAALAALGADAVVARRAGARTVLASATILALGSLGATWALTARLPPDVAGVAAHRALRGAWHAVAGAAGLGAWLVLRDRAGRAAPALLAALAWLASAAASPAALRPGDPAARLDAPGPAIAAPAPGPRIVSPYEYAPLDAEPSVDPVDQAVRTYAARAYVGFNVAARLDSLESYGAMLPAAPARLRVALGPAWLLALRRYGATHVVVDPPRTFAHELIHRLAVRGAVRIDGGVTPFEIWAVPHRPWASFAPQVLAVADAGAALAETARAVQEDSGRVVIEAPAADAAAAGRVLSVSREPEALRVEAESAGDAILVVADPWWPGWEATIDGAGVAIHRADAFVRAVRWPRGRHVLEMRYRPPEVGTGLLVSAAGAAALAAWIALTVRARRRGG